MNQIIGCLSQEHLPGGDGVFSMPEQHVQHARCIAHSLHTNKCGHALSNPPLEMMASLLASTQVKKFV